MKMCTISSYFLMIMVCVSGHIYAFQPSMTVDGSKGRLGCECWGYVEVRQGAHMFWWLYYSTHPDGYVNRPWIIWIQGGPGLSSIELGNFQEIGPMDHLQQEREETWVKMANVLFVENPVGVGFSYVEDHDPDLYATNLQEISADLITLLQIFLQNYREFQDMPLYLFGQSYGGKMATGLAYYLNKAIANNEIKCNLTAVAIGNGWISPMDFCVQWVQMLYQMSRVDAETVEEAQSYLARMASNVDNHQWLDAYKDWADYQSFVMGKSSGVDIYHILRQHPVRGNGTEPMSVYFRDLTSLIDGPVREKLRIIPPNVVSGSKYSVHRALKRDFMVPVIDLVDELLKNTDVQVIVYEGQMDIICCAAGAMEWVNKLTWPGMQRYHQARRVNIHDPSSNGTKLEAIVKSAGQFKFYWILDAGHAVPADTPKAAFRMLERILNNTD